MTMPFILKSTPEPIISKNNKYSTNLSGSETDLALSSFSSHLKQCFSFCTIFPREYEFDENELFYHGMSCKSSIHYDLIKVSESFLLQHTVARYFLHGYEILLSLKCFSYCNHTPSLYIVSRNISMASSGQALNRPTLLAGYKFSPDNDDLIVYYLKRKILGQQLPADVIPTTDVYASSPDKLPLDDFKGGVPNEWFFFSTRSKDGNSIALDGGYYEIDPEGAGPITWEGKVVGYVKTLNFYQGSSPNGIETEWMVEEFRVNPEFVPVNDDDRSTQEKIENLVACKISRVQPEPEW
ncbi:hypothetical protein POTOM_042634 [Populus tomentosa]|uniref:NAC domain-containing protein n=1 Tax=Populus tomentosa TaxID=118781 RepID=A0A8X8CFP0_POPTO|nr:hypothetical protein POTOM_042634 [Populus tomentosa]